MGSAATVLPLSTFSRVLIGICLIGLLLPNLLLARSIGTISMARVVFEENVGQAPHQYKFLSRHGNVRSFFSPEGVEILLPNRTGDPAHIRLTFVGANHNVEPAGLSRLSSVTNYLVGAGPTRWIRHVPNDSGVIYRGIYSGVDLVFHAQRESLEHDFRIRAGADPAKLRFRIDGAHGLSLTSVGDLSLSISEGEFVIRKPAAYQEVKGRREPVAASFFILPDSSIEFQVGRYDHQRELVIDPVFSFSTYLAGSTLDQGAALATDATGNVYITGFTNSIDFPVVDGIQETASGSPTAFVSKFDPTGSKLIYSTYIGGTSRNYGNAIAIASNGNIIVAGTSSSNDFPHAGSVPATTCTGNNDCYFLVSLTPDGSAFNYAGLIGGIAGTAIDTGSSGSGSLTLDGGGNAYLTGVTDSSAFEITPGTLSNTVPGYPYNSTFVLKADPLGALVYSTIIPGTAPSNLTTYLNNVFIPVGIAVDTSGQVTIAGTSGPGLPSTAGVVLSTFPTQFAPSVLSPSAGFVLQLNATASAINYASYVPGVDIIGGFAVDGSGNSYLAGGTAETDLPVSSNAFQNTLKTGSCKFTCDSGVVLKLDNGARGVLAATYLGGTPTTYGGTAFSGIALDSKSNVYVGGMSASQDFPLINPFVSLQESGDTTFDMVIAELSPDLSTLLFGSFLSSTDQIFNGTTFSAITVDSQNNPIITGQTTTTDFPTTPGSFQSAPPAQAGHPFVTKFNMTTPAPSVCADSWNVNFGSVPVKQSVSQVVHVTDCGNASLHLEKIVASSPDFTANETCGAIQPGSACPISISFSPTHAYLESASVTLTDDAAIPSQSIGVSGQGIPSLGLGIAPGGSSSATVAAGNAATYMLSIGGGGLSGSANITCTGAPTGATCSAPSTENVNPTSATNFTVTITTTSTAAALLRHDQLKWIWIWTTALVGALTTPSAKKRTRYSYWHPRLCLALSLFLICSCGGGSSSGSSQTNPNGTPSGDYTLTVSATTSDGTSGSQSLHLTVQ